MPPIHTGMSVQVSLPSTVEIYLRQWLKIVSGDRVYIHQHTNGLTHSYTVFKCRTCGDNWHVGDENFEGTQIPQTLKDWVTKHRHVCPKYSLSVGLGGYDQNTKPCGVCHWPYGAHEESWLQSKTETDVLDKTGKVLPGMKWVVVRKSESVNTLTTIPEFTGRVFRDSE
jgi:hypothetical protein